MVKKLVNVELITTNYATKPTGINMTIRIYLHGQVYQLT